MASVLPDVRVHRFVQAIRGAFTLALRERIDGRPLASSLDVVSDYLRFTMGSRTTEAARVLHLNKRNVLIRDEVMADGTTDAVAIYPREVTRRALELGSSAVILVHNHPSGDATPSRQDITLTKALAGALALFGIAFHDHLIVTAYGQISLRAAGHL